MLLILFYSSVRHGQIHCKFFCLWTYFYDFCWFLWQLMFGWNALPGSINQRLFSIFLRFSENYFFQILILCPSGDYDGGCGNSILVCVSCKKNIFYFLPHLCILYGHCVMFLYFQLPGGGFCGLCVCAIVFLLLRFWHYIHCVHLAL